MRTQTIMMRVARNWPLLVIVITIFASGWSAKVSLSSEIASAVQTVEKRFEDRMTRMALDVREIRDVLLRGIRLQPVPQERASAAVE